MKKKIKFKYFKSCLLMKPCRKSLFKSAFCRCLFYECWQLVDANATELQTFLKMWMWVLIMPYLILMSRIVTRQTCRWNVLVLTNEHCDLQYVHIINCQYAEAFKQISAIFFVFGVFQHPYSVFLEDKYTCRSPRTAPKFDSVTHNRAKVTMFNQPICAVLQYEIAIFNVYLWLGLEIWFIFIFILASAMTVNLCVPVIDTEIHKTCFLGI